MKINSNIQAQITNSVLKANESRYSKSTEKLSSGYKLNHASDSPAGMAISNKMNAQIKSLNRARDNAKNAVNVTQTADGSLNEVHDMLQRMNELAIKSANGTMSESDRAAVQEEIDALRKEIDRIAADTEYNTQNLLGGEQGLKGYTNDFNTKVLRYDMDFPINEYQMQFIDDSYTNVQFKVLVDDDNDETTPKVPQDVPNIKDVVVKPEYEIDEVYTREEYEANKADILASLDPADIVESEVDPETGDEIGNVTVKRLVGGRVTATLTDGSELVTKYDYDPAKGKIPTRDPIVIDVTGVGGMKIQVGTSAGKEIQMVIPKMDTENLGIDRLNVTTQDYALEAIDKISEAIEYVSRSRSQIGAYQNRLESTVTSLDENIEDLTESYSTIKDVDMAEEMVNYTTLQVLVQAGTSMLTQANEQPQQALQLLQ